MKKNKEISAMGRQELDSRLSELRKELIKQSAQVATGTIPKNPKMIMNIKKTIAKILTIKNKK